MAERLRLGRKTKAASGTGRKEARVRAWGVGCWGVPGSRKKINGPENQVGEGEKCSGAHEVSAETDRDRDPKHVGRRALGEEARGPTFPPFFLRAPRDLPVPTNAPSIRPLVSHSPCVLKKRGSARPSHGTARSRRTSSPSLRYGW